MTDEDINKIGFGDLPGKRRCIHFDVKPVYKSNEYLGIFVGAAGIVLIFALY